ncbi:MAG: hypothetical protein AAGK93_02505, partial [Pseudomonadota bacterium]
MEDALKYGLLLIGNLIAFAGAWLVSFTKTDEVTQRKSLTKWGRWALPIAVILLVAGFGLTVINDRKSAHKAQLAQKTAQEQNQEIRILLTESERRDSEISALLTQLVTQVGGNSPTRDAALLTELSDNQIVSELASEDPELAAALSQLEAQLGGRETTLRRMEQRDVTLPDDTENVLVAMQLGLRWFGGSPLRSQDDEVDPITISALLSIIRGVDADIVAVTEISDIRAFEELVNKVPQYRAVYGARISGGRLGTAMLYRADRVQLARQPETLDGGDYRFPRPPQLLRFAFKDTELQTVVVHLISQRGSDEDPRGRLRRELEIGKIIAGLEERTAFPTLLLGVLNAPSSWVEFDGLRNANARFAGRDLPSDA